MMQTIFLLQIQQQDINNQSTATAAGFCLTCLFPSITPG